LANIDLPEKSQAKNIEYKPKEKQIYPQIREQSVAILY
jgi:hypothetical protein